MLKVCFANYIDRIHKYFKFDDYDYPYILCLLENAKNNYNWTYYNDDYKCIVIYALTILLYEKMYNDNVKSNKYYAYFFGMEHKKINFLEDEFLKVNNWNFFVKQKKHDEMKNIIEKQGFKNKILNIIYFDNRTIASCIIDNIMNETIKKINNREIAKNITDEIIEKTMITIDTQDEATNELFINIFEMIYIIMVA